MNKKTKKLVRDRIPEIIIESGDKPIAHIADEAEYKTSLLKKIDEELEEFKENLNKEEAADILEVLYAVFDLMGWDKEEIEQIRQKKAEKRGGFTKRIILDAVERKNSV